MDIDKRIFNSNKMYLYFQPEERVEAESEMKMRRMVLEENHLDRALCLTF